MSCIYPTTHTRLVKPRSLLVSIICLKQEYVNSRYHLYCAMNETAFDFLNRDVKLFDIGDGTVWSSHTEELKSAFSSAYASFDKIGLFLNAYYAIGLRPDEVTFRKVWSEKPKGASTYQQRKAFVGKQNWPLRGLYFLSKDLYDDTFQDAAEPDAARLSKLRNRIEHRFLSLHFFGQGMPAGTDTHQFVSLEEFQKKSLRILRMAREALIYLSLAMHCEEKMLHGGDDYPNEIIPSVRSREIETDEMI